MTITHENINTLYDTRKSLKNYETLLCLRGMFNLNFRVYPPFKLSSSILGLTFDVT